MTVETEVAALTSAVDTLTASVDVRLVTLDAKVTNAQLAETGSIAASGTASGFADDAEGFKDQAYQSAQVAASAASQDLTAIAASKSVTAVDVFVYDTSKDSDGGAWRKRTQGTSWYNETLNTATRGSRKEFPAVAVIVAELTQVTIYDGDDPAMPMWMVFNVAANTALHSAAPISVAMINGTLSVATGAVLDRIDFLADMYGLTTTTVYNDRSGIINRNTSVAISTGTSKYYNAPIVNGVCNDVAMTILPNAPIDSATGLPIPTIAVATDGGVSVITDDGSVVDLTYVVGVNNTAGHVQFVGDGIGWSSYKLGTGYAYIQVLHTLPNADYTTAPDAVYRSGVTGDLTLLTANNYSSAYTGDAVGTIAGLNLLKENLTTPAEGSVAYITSDYNTGFMTGDIKLAALSDTDATDVTDANLITNGDFSSSTGWIAQTGWAISSGVATCDGTNGAYLYTASGIPANTHVVASFEITSHTSGSIRIGASGVSPAQTFSSVGKHSVAFTSSSASGVELYSISFNGSIDNVSVTVAEQDRSVNANGLAVHGTIQRNPVATGADLVGYSGFNTNNYLEQPYNSDLNFGTGDFSVMGWCNPTASGSTYAIIGVGDLSGSNGGWLLGYQTTGIFRVWEAATSAHSTILISSTSIAPLNVWTHVCFSRTSGVMKISVNGSLEETVPDARTMTHTNAVLTIGIADNGAYPLTIGSLANWRISATAPSAQQIKEIYEAEKPLFQAGAQATLYGTSDAVTALAHDSYTNLLHVGTSAGRSVFQGLQRVSNTTDAVTTAISASNDLVVED